MMAPTKKKPKKPEKTGVNDSDEELQQIATFIHSVGPEIPWHVTRFYPAYKMQDVSPTELKTLRRARDIGLATGLRYVYEGNVPGEGGREYLLLPLQGIIDRTLWLLFANQQY